jgi:hypothetical protein
MIDLLPIIEMPIYHRKCHGRYRRTGRIRRGRPGERGRITGIAVPVFRISPTGPSGAVSISAPAHRMPLSALRDDVTAIRAAWPVDPEEN